MITAVYIDEINGLVHVDVSSLASTSAQAVSGRYGPIVQLGVAPPGELLTCTSRDDCGTKGGLHANGFPATCTTGFLGKVSAGLMMVTAGHCIRDAGFSFYWNNGGASWGYGWGYQICNGCWPDAGMFHITTSVPSTKNQYFASSASDIRSITSTMTEGSLTLGRVVCRSAWTSGWGCGPITVRDHDVNVSGDIYHPYIIKHAWVVQLHSDRGDSGAGFIYTSSGVTSAAGILFGGILAGDGYYYTWFSPIEQVYETWANYGFHVCLSASC